MTGVRLLLSAAGLTVAILALAWAVMGLIDAGYEAMRTWREDRKGTAFDSQRVAQMRHLLASESSAPARRSR